MKNKKLNKIKIFLPVVFFSYSLFATAYIDYPLSYVVESCKIIQKRLNPKQASEDDFLIARNKYKTCMNFIMSLSTTLNQRCISIKNEMITPSNNITYADLSDVNSTKEIINEVIKYSERNPQFINQIAWLHATKAISKRWPCK